MSNINSPNKQRALAALNSLLMQVSAITIKDIGVGSSAASSEKPGREFDILAHVEVFGHAYTLACQISGGSGPEHVRPALEELHHDIAHLAGTVTPILILPVLSPEVQALCDECKTAFLDLHGNGRLAIGEVFISTRSLPRRALRRPIPATASSIRGLSPVNEERSVQRAMRGFPPVQAATQNRHMQTFRHGRAQ